MTTHDTWSKTKDDITVTVSKAKDQTAGGRLKAFLEFLRENIVDPGYGQGGGGRPDQGLPGEVAVRRVPIRVCRARALAPIRACRARSRDLTTPCRSRAASRIRVCRARSRSRTRVCRAISRASTTPCPTNTSTRSSSSSSASA